jgi:hypothetical protein
MLLRQLTGGLVLAAVVCATGCSCCHKHARAVPAAPCCPPAPAGAVAPVPAPVPAPPPAAFSNAAPYPAYYRR